MTNKTLAPLFAAALGAFTLAGALAGPDAALAQDEPRPTLVYDYAVAHPVENAPLSTSPTIGASVPPSVTVATVEGEDTPYGYIYYQGQPVIVDLDTRSVVRLGN